MSIGCGTRGLGLHTSRVRHAVFVGEQGIFARSDRDMHDDEPGVLHAVALVGGRVVGAVRLYPAQMP